MTPADGGRVVLVHGLWMNGLAMLPLARRLERCGFEVKRYGYQSMRRGLHENARRLAAVCDKSVAPLNLVGHSLGGLLDHDHVAPSPAGQSASGRAGRQSVFEQRRRAGPGAIQDGSRIAWAHAPGLAASATATHSGWRRTWCDRGRCRHRSRQGGCASAEADMTGSCFWTKPMCRERPIPSCSIPTIPRCWFCRQSRKPSARF